MRRQALLPLMIMAGCGNPSAVPIAVAETPVAPPVFQEALPMEVEPAPGLTFSIDHTRLLGLYQCWFQHPYEYMFSGGTPQLGNARGVFMAGVAGILYYGDFAECVAQDVGQKMRGYADPSPLGRLAELPLYAAGKETGHPFHHFNPKIIEWGYGLIPAPDDVVVDGKTAREVYDGMFFRFFRLMGESYVDLRKNYDYGSEQAEYMRAWQRGHEMLDWLEGRYGGRLSRHGGYADGTQMTPAMAHGFWIRRGIDGTDDELWEGLRRVYARFDPGFYDRLRNDYASVPIAW